MSGVYLVVGQPFFKGMQDLLGVGESKSAALANAATRFNITAEAMQGFINQAPDHTQIQFMGLPEGYSAPLDAIDVWREAYQSYMSERTAKHTAQRCLETTQCPACHAQEKFRMEMTDSLHGDRFSVVWTDEGPDAVLGSEPEWPEDGQCECLSCGFKGTTEQFESHVELFWKEDVA
ncbi:hypothetical protein [Neptuniibacter sp. QD37_11]|uniref:hypothetical protein n=1 Tax=Neptuniibacter sp. QD37_11 TaxID=3398209 RepID=UPI0039F4B828